MPTYGRRKSRQLAAEAEQRATEEAAARQALVHELARLQAELARLRRSSQ